MKMVHAGRLNLVEFSPIRKIAERANEMRREGREILDLTLGEPDFQTPSVITQAAIDALRSGLTHYTSNYGLDELRHEIATKLKYENQVHASAEEVVITTGASEAVYVSMMATLNAGDEVLIPTPAWPHYTACCRLADAVPVPVPLQVVDGRFRLDFNLLEERITPKTRLLIINSPSNPTGMMLAFEDCKQLSDIARRHNLIVISDEIYEKIILSHSKHFSLAAFPGMKERTITINGFSKAYAMTGWRIGYLHAPADLVQHIVRVHQYNTVCLPAFVQQGAMAALRKAQNAVQVMRQEFHRRAQLLIERLSKSNTIRVIYPDGTFYLFMDVSRFGVPVQQLAYDLLESVEVATVPGDAFGFGGEGYLRVSFATDTETLIQAGDRLISYLG